MLDRQGPDDRDPVDAVLDQISTDAGIQRLVIGIRRRSPVGKALLGSISQRLLLECPIPVLAVKVTG
ncbi:MAG TPA: universal stress protein [Propionibacteriaceae bacterium]